MILSIERSRRPSEKQESTGVVFNVQSYSIHDGPGIRTVVFLKGCPLSCVWCSNPESQRIDPELGIMYDRCTSCGECVRKCPQGALSLSDSGTIEIDREKCIVCGICEEACPYNARKVFGRETSLENLMSEIEKDMPFYIRSGGGVTFSGGEPTLQDTILLPLLSACKEKFIATAIETCGFIRDREKLGKILQLVDLVLYDIKCIDEEMHKQFTGVSNRIILENAKYIASTEKKMIIRIPVIPGFNATVEEMKKIARFTADLKTVTEVNLLPYHELGKGKYKMLQMQYNLKASEALTDERLAKFQSIFENHNIISKID